MDIGTYVRPASKVRNTKTAKIPDAVMGFE